VTCSGTLREVDPQGSTRSQILDAVIGQIETGGESSVRLRDVATAVGLAEPSLYHYFQSRESLIDAAHAHRFRINLAVTLDPFIEMMRHCKSREEFEQLVLDVYERSFAIGRDEVRATRAEIIGHASRRPALRVEVIAAMHEALHPAAETLQYAQVQGWMRPDVDATAFTYWNLANITGLIFPELQRDRGLLEAYRALMLESISHIIHNWPGTPIESSGEPCE